MIERPREAPPNAAAPMKQTHLRSTPAALALLLAACPEQNIIDSLLDEMPAQRGEYLSYHANPSATLCAGTLTHVDGFVPFVASELGLSSPSDLHYLWLDQEQKSRLTYPCDKTPGCTFGTVATSGEPAHVHEVVHIVTGYHKMNNWPFFTEGTAWAYDAPGARYVTPIIPGEPLADPRPMMLLADPLELHYGVAGSFVTLLLARHGPEKFVRFSQQLTEPRTMANLEATFQRVYGSELAAEVDLYMHGSPCTEDMFQVIPYDCAMPEVAWSNPPQWTYDNTMDCGHDDVIGGIDAQVWPSVRSVTMDVPISDAYQLSLVSDGEVTVQIGACFGCPWQPRYHVLKPGDTTLVELDAGAHYVRMVARSDSSPAVTIAVQPNPLAGP